MNKSMIHIQITIIKFLMELVPWQRYITEIQRME